MSDTREHINKRYDGLDIIRSLAIIFVPAVHFFAHTGFYNTLIEGRAMIVSEILRTIFITCVPLFLLLTGVLHRDTKITKMYYLKLIRVLITYMLCGALCQTYIAVTDGGRTIKSAFLSFFDFTACQYAWYIEMYIGLYLLIPFLNILWEAIDKKMRNMLLLNLLIITCLPSIICTFDFNNNLWWQSNQLSYSQFTTEYWLNIYPITYFFVGKYLAENGEFWQSKLKAYMIPLMAIIFGLLNYLKNLRTVFPWNQDTSYAGYQCLVMSVMIFVVFMNVKIKKRNSTKSIYAYFY